MFKYLKYIIPFFLLFACNSNEKPISTDKEQELRKHFVSQYKQIDPDSRVDSFAFVKLDTITLQKNMLRLPSTLWMNGKSKIN